MVNQNYEYLLAGLSARAQTISIGGVLAELRNCPDRQPGQVDPRSRRAALATREDFRAHKKEYHSELWANEDKLFGPEHPEYYEDPIAKMRFQFGWRSSDRSQGIEVRALSLTNDYGSFPVWRYNPASQKNERPCLVFFHGGGFVAGDTATVENQCKLIAQLADAVVLSVDYPLAPEHKHPAGFEACYHTVCWAWENAAELGIDRQKIGVAGDSAGGTFALACSLRDRDEKAGHIHYQALIYPSVSRSWGPEDRHYYWSEDLYDNPDKDPVIDAQIREIGKTIRDSCAWYVPEGTDRFDPYISPITGVCTDLPPTLLMTAEYDYLRAECDAYLDMLHKAHVPVRAIRYGGIFHGTFDRLGYAPQIEDMVREIARDLREEGIWKKTKTEL